MAERTPEFRRRALSAAGPVFLATLGVVLLSVLAVLTLFRLVPSDVGWLWAIVGAAALLGGILWGAASREREPRLAP